MPLPAVHRAAQPRMRLVLLLREPAERMHSAFWYYGCMHGLYQRHGLSAAGFHAFAEARPTLHVPRTLVVCMRHNAWC